MKHTHPSSVNRENDEILRWMDFDEGLIVSIGGEFNFAAVKMIKLYIRYECNLMGLVVGTSLVTMNVHMMHCKAL